MKKGLKFQKIKYDMQQKVRNLTGNWNWNEYPIQKHTSIEIKRNKEQMRTNQNKQVKHENNEEIHNKL